MHKKQSFAFSLVSLLCLGLLSCSQGGSNTELKKLTITGSTTVAPLANEIAKSFESKNANVRVDVQTGGSSRGLYDAEQGLADIGMVSRALKPAETPNVLTFVIAQDGIGIIVNKDNDIKALSDEQIVKIYTGEIENWKAVGGKAGPITVVNKAEGHSTLELFLKYFKLKNAQVKADVVIKDNQQGIKTVAGNKDAIGYVSIGTASYSIANGVAIKLLPVGGVEASTKTVGDGSFPLSRPLNLVTNSSPSPLTQQFIDFAQSKEVHDLVEAQNFVPIQ